MALKPEFIGLLRDIRDRIFPSINTSHDDIVTKHAEVVALTSTIEEISVKQPITIVPIQENGESGLPTVTFNNTTKEFEFGIPSGIDGQDLAIKWVVDLTADLYILIPETGDVAYSNEDGKLYIKKNTGVNLNAADWTTGTIMTPTTTFRDMTDTPIEYVGYANYIVTVSADESKLVFRTVQDLTQQIADLKLNKSGDTMTGNLSIQKQTIEDNAIIDLRHENGTIHSRLLAYKDGGAVTLDRRLDDGTVLTSIVLSADGNVTVNGVEPLYSNQLTRKDYVDNADNLRLLKTGGTISGNLTVTGTLSSEGSNVLTEDGLGIVWSGNESTVANAWGNGVFLLVYDTDKSIIIAAIAGINCNTHGQVVIWTGANTAEKVDVAYYVAPDNLFKVREYAESSIIYLNLQKIYKLSHL